MKVTRRRRRTALFSKAVAALAVPVVMVAQGAVASAQHGTAKTRGPVDQGCARCSQFRSEFNRDERNVHSVAQPPRFGDLVLLRLRVDGEVRQDT